MLNKEIVNNEIVVVVVAVEGLFLGCVVPTFVAAVVVHIVAADVS